MMKECFLTREYQRRSLYRFTIKISCPPKRIRYANWKSHIYIETITKSNVWQIYKGYDGRWIQTKLKNHSLFIKHSLNSKAWILIIYIDDMIVTENNNQKKAALKKRLVEVFKIKEFLGIEVVQIKNISHPTKNMLWTE